MRSRFYIVILLLLAGVLSSPGKAPEIIDIGPEELAGGSGRLVNIATDRKDQPHIIADIGGSNMSFFYDRIGGSWQVSSFDSGGESHQSYNPHIEINEYDQAWYSVVKWWSHGMGMMIRNNMSTAPSGVLKYTKTTGGAGGLPVANLSLDINSNNRCVVYGGNGGWYEKVIWKGSSFASGGIGTLDVGPGGEKNYFHISRAGNFRHPNGEVHPVWHACSDWSYNNSVRKAAGKEAVSWIGSVYYPYTGDDGCYPMVIGDTQEPQTAYLFADYKQFGGPGVMLQIWKADSNGGDGHFVFPTGNLLNVDPAGTSGLRRYEPRLAPAKDGGAWACYTAGGNIRIRYIPSNITGSAGLGNIIEFPGVRGSIAVDRKGNLHVAYINNGVRYRKLTIAGGTGNSVATRAGDFNGDGVDDLATCDRDTYKWYIRDVKNGNTLTFGSQWGFPGTVPLTGNFVRGPGEESPGDDMCIYYAKGGTWYIRSGIGGPESTVHWGYPGTIPVVADYDGDGMDDFAVYAPGSGYWHVLGANGRLIIDTEVWGGFESAVAVPADYDNDGAADLGIYDSATGKWYIRTSRRFLLHDHRLGAPAMLPASADYDGDGITDPAVYNPADGKWYISKGSHPAEYILRGVNWGGVPGMIPVPADYDGDGKADLAVFDVAHGRWYVKRAAPDGRIILWEKSWGGPGMVPVPGDYDGDGRADLALFRPDAGLWYIVRADESGHVILWEEAWGGPGMAAVPGDFNGDGKADLALYQRAKGLWYIKDAIAKKPAFLVGENWGAPSMRAVSGDFNGDGKADLAVYQGNTGKWYARTIGGRIILFGRTAGHRGIPAPGDFDGDGKADTTVIDRATFGWYCKKGSRILADGVQWGAPSMFPVPGDFNGGGADLAVWDKATGKWYIVTLSGTQLAWGTDFGLARMHPVSGDFNGDGLNDLTLWDSIYWKEWGQPSPSWYSFSIAPRGGGRILWAVPWGTPEHIAIGTRD